MEIDAHVLERLRILLDQPASHSAAAAADVEDRLVRLEREGSP
jgi:hypothetical protein